MVNRIIFAYLCAKKSNEEHFACPEWGPLVAVAILYYLHFNKKGEAGTQDVVAAGSSQTPVFVSPGSIAYVNSDSLLEEYEYYKSKKADFEMQQSRIKNELKNQGAKLQQEVETYQKQAIGMTDKEKAEKEYELGMKQQQIMQKKEEMLTALDEEQGKSAEELYTRLNDYLKRHNKGKNYGFVLGYQKGGGILFANDSLNITREVLEGLNKEYSEQNK